MREYNVIKGKVVGKNSLIWNGRVVYCWENEAQAAAAPQPLDLSEHKEKIIEVRGRLHGDLWEATFERVVPKNQYKEIIGTVNGTNTVKGPKGTVSCFRHGMKEAAFLPLNLVEYMGRIVTVAGQPGGDALYHAFVSSVPETPMPKPTDKEAQSLNDLMHIRADNRKMIEAVNGNLGTALGFKWTNNQNTGHPCIIIFVPQKTLPDLVPEAEKVPEYLEARDGTWCFTDVVTGGKAKDLQDIDPLPPLSAENKRIVQELKSGRVGLVGGIQLAFFSNGTEPYVGTAGIAVQDTEAKQVGFLTNQHVAETRGRRMYHPVHRNFPIGTTSRVAEYAYDEEWYNNVIDEENSYVRCDCGFVVVDKHLAGKVIPGLHAIGRTGPLLPINPETMDIIGQKVISIGRTRGIQRGTVAAYAYEWHDEADSYYTDLLIIGEEGNAFSWKGDSGKVIVTDDDRHLPVALLWGGWQERLRHGKEQEMWSYAVDLGKVLELLGLTLME